MGWDKLIALPAESLMYTYEWPKNIYVFVITGIL